MKEKAKKEEKKKNWWWILLLLLLLFLIVKNLPMGVWLMARRTIKVPSANNKVMVNGGRYEINESDPIEHEKNFSGYIVMNWEMTAESKGQSKPGAKDWRTDWTLTIDYEGKVSVDYNLPQVMNQSQEQPMSWQSQVEFSLAGVREGETFKGRGVAVSTESYEMEGTLVKDMGEEGAVIRIGYKLKPEQQAQIDEMEEITAGTAFSGWGTLGVNHPPIELTIKKVNN